MTLTGINHAAFITGDLEGTIRFYRDLLGLELSVGIGHDKYRHYFFRLGDDHIAFFEYAGARKMPRKFHGKPTTEARGFDHISMTVGTCEELFEFKDRLEAAGIEVVGAIDHGTIWSIYFFDPNEIPLEISWDCLEILETPAVVDDEPMAIVAEGSGPQPGIWPEPGKRTPPEGYTARAGNGYAMRDAFLKEGRAKKRPELEELEKRAQRSKAKAPEPPPEWRDAF